MNLHAFVADSRPFEPDSPDGPLRGMEVALKDLFAVRGRTSSFGLAAWRDTHAPADRHAPVVTKILAGGARVVGLTKMDQLAYSLIGNVGEGTAPVNPFRPAAFCGGSSSGSASAVAGGAATVGLGTDTAGSIRIPAALCGLYGLRPTHGAIDTAGVIPLAGSLDTVGLIAASLGRLRDLYGHLTDAPGRPGGFSEVLSPADLDPALVTAETGGVLDRFSTALAGQLAVSHRRVPVGAFTSAATADLLARVQGREIWSTHGAWLTEHGDSLADDVRVRVDRCRALSLPSDGGRAPDIALRSAHAERVAALLGADRLLVLPAMPEAWPGRDWSQAQLAVYRTACVRLTAASSLSGLPQLVVRLPAGVARGDVTAAALIGPRGSDSSLLAAADAFEAAG